jgi:hypothetical protein
MVFCPAVNIAADIRESERNASARVAIAELFSLAHGQAADVLAISWLLCALGLANPPHHCEKNPALC